MTATHQERLSSSHASAGVLPTIGLAACRRDLGDPACRDDDQVVGMHSAFLATGGLLSIPEVRMLFRRHGGTDADRLADWICTREAIAFEWRQATWLPMFQFNRKTLAVHPSLKPVLRELSDIYDGWETANWFALRNTWLAGHKPVDMLTRNLSEVWYAARVDRFIALGESSLEQQPWNSAPSGSPSGVFPFAEIDKSHTERSHRGRSAETQH